MKTYLSFLILIHFLLTACTTAQLETTATSPPTNTPVPPTTTHSPTPSPTVTFTPIPTETSTTENTNTPTPTPTEEVVEETRVANSIRDIGSKDEFGRSTLWLLKIQLDLNHFKDDRFPEANMTTVDIFGPPDPLLEEFIDRAYNVNVTLEDFCLYIRRNMGAGVGWAVNLSKRGTLISNPYDPKSWEIVYKELGEQSGVYNCTIFQKDHPDFMPFTEFGDSKP